MIDNLHSVADHNEYDNQSMLFTNHYFNWNSLPPNNLYI